MKVQPLEHQHLEECADLFIAVFSCEPWNEIWSHENALKRLEDCYNTPGAYGIVAIADKVCGFAIGYVERWHQHSHFYLKEMCVQSTRQRSGIGTTIIEALQQDLFSKDITMTYLLTVRDSPAAAFYAKCGFANSPKMIMMSKATETPHAETNDTSSSAFTSRG